MPHLSPMSWPLASLLAWSLMLMMFTLFLYHQPMSMSHNNAFMKHTPKLNNYWTWIYWKSFYNLNKL